jgi:hypothetical protein
MLKLVYYCIVFVFLILVGILGNVFRLVKKRGKRYLVYVLVVLKL